VRTMGSMLRAILVGLLAVSATSSCSGGSDTPKVAPGAVAGRVLEASGSVAATRNGSSRALAVGAEVFADDVIDTANGSVLILLHHNHARWSVEGNAAARVDQSLAWKLAKQDGSAGAVDHASSAAGREGERTAADTRATTEHGGGVRMRGGTGTAESMPMPPAADPAPVPVTPAPATQTAPSAPPPQANVAGGGAAETAKHVDQASSTPHTTGAASPKGTGPAEGAKERRPGPTAPTASSSALAPPPSPEAQLRGALEARRDELLRCFTGKPALTLVLRVASGAPTIELIGGTAPVPVPVRACLDRVVKQIPMAGLTASASIALTR
jgi:hypothetical protein